MAGLDVEQTDAALESLGRSGLIEQGPGTEAAFVHPLFRQALYDDLGAAMRARLHARAFAVLAARGLDAAAAEHAIHADLAGDMEAVAVLERAGRAARRAGALDAAVARLDAAVALAAGRASRGLLLAQAEALLAGGQPQRAACGLPVACSARPGLPLSAAGAGAVDAGPRAGHDRRYLTRRGRVQRGRTDLAETADPGIAAEVLMDAAFSAMLTAGPGRALALAAGPGTWPPGWAAAADPAEAHWGRSPSRPATRPGSPRPSRMRPGCCRQHPRRTARRPRSAADWGLINGFAFATMLVERLAESDRAFTVLRAAADRAGDPDGHRHAGGRSRLRADPDGPPG